MKIKGIFYCIHNMKNMLYIHIYIYIYITLYIYYMNIYIYIYIYIYHIEKLYINIIFILYINSTYLYIIYKSICSHVHKISQTKTLLLLLVFGKTDEESRNQEILISQFFLSKTRGQTLKANSLFKYHIRRE